AGRGPGHQEGQEGLPQGDPVTTKVTTKRYGAPAPAMAGRGAPPAWRKSATLQGEPISACCAGQKFLPPGGCGSLLLLRPSQRACKRQTAAPAPLRLFRPQDAPQLRSPWGQN